MTDAASYRYPVGRLLIFARAPVAGAVKTRLAAGIGADKVTCCPLGDGYEFSFQYDYARTWKYLVDTFGEAGLFFHSRTASVDVVEDARLICITRENLETLRRRYPRIAARVFSNLNEILSTRLVHATDRLT